jgi:hypothetical protein
LKARKGYHPINGAVPSWIITSPRAEPTTALYKQRDRRELGAK